VGHQESSSLIVLPGRGAQGALDEKKPGNTPAELVEAAGIEPASASLSQSVLHA